MTKQLPVIPPTVRLGKWSVGLIIAMPILFLLGSSFTNSLYRSTGYQALDFDAFGEDADPRVRAEKLDEGLEILLAL